MADLDLELRHLAARLTELGKHGSAGVVRRAADERKALRELAERLLVDHHGNDAGQEIMKILNA